MKMQHHNLLSIRCFALITGTKNVAIDHRFWRKVFALAMCLPLMMTSTAMADVNPAFVEGLRDQFQITRVRRYGYDLVLDGKTVGARVTVLPSLGEQTSELKRRLLSTVIGSGEKLEPPLGDDGGAKLRPGADSTIQFVRGSVIVEVSGREWNEAYKFAKILDATILAMGKDEMLSQVEMLHDRSAKPVPLLPVVKQAVSELLTQLEASKTDGERQRLIAEISDSMDKSAVPVIITQLDPKYPFSVRGHAIQALGRLGDVSAIPVLVAILERPIKGEVKDEDGSGREPIERRLAVVALGEIGAASALPLLENIAKSEAEYPSVKESAGVAIRRLVENR